jgi:hypothetical protein
MNIVLMVPLVRSMKPSLVNSKVNNLLTEIITEVVSGHCMGHCLELQLREREQLHKCRCGIVLYRDDRSRSLEPARVATVL